MNKLEQNARLDQEVKPGFTLTCGCRVEPSEDDTVVIKYCPGHDDVRWTYPSRERQDEFKMISYSDEEKVEISEAERDEEEEPPAGVSLCIDRDYMLAREGDDEEPAEDQEAEPGTVDDIQPWPM